MWIILNDITYISSAICVLFLLVSAILGFYIYTDRKINNSVLGIIGETFTGLGLVGTVLGMIWMLISLPLGSIDMTDVSQIQELMFGFMIGLGTAFGTTLFGLIARMLLTYQLVVSKRHEE